MSVTFYEASCAWHSAIVRCIIPSRILRDYVTTYRIRTPLLLFGAQEGVLEPPGRE